MKRLIRSAFVLVGFSIAGISYAFFIERNWLVVTRHRLLVRGLPPQWNRICVVQLADFHCGSRGEPTRMLRRAIVAAVALRPDLVVLTGDYSDDGRLRPLDLLKPLARVAPTFAVLGNHDYFQGYNGADRITAALEAQGITVLRNARAEYVYKGTAGSIVGFDDDLDGPGTDVDGMVVHLNGEKPQLVLIHEPDVIERFPPQWAGLALAGHTHGAQVRLSPIRTIDWIRWARGSKHSHYPRGWFSVGGNRLYVNRGLGVAGFPIRFATRPEVACFTLIADAGDTPGARDRVMWHLEPNRAICGR